MTQICTKTYKSFHQFSYSFFKESDGQCPRRVASPDVAYYVKQKFIPNYFPLKNCTVRQCHENCE
jgi:hypothetical protein